MNSRDYNNSDIKRIIEIEEFKRTLPSNIKYTIIEEHLAKLYRSIQNDTNLPAILNTIDSTITNLQISASTIREKLTIT